MDDGADGQGTDGKRAEQRRKGPRKLSPRYLENAALHYLKQYAATQSGLRRVLLRKVDRSLRFHGPPPERGEAVEWVEALVAKLVRGGLLDDAAYAEMKAQTLRASGRSARVIAQRLRLKGVPENVLTEKLAQATLEISEVDAASRWARKKRLGPWRATEEARKENRERDLAALARAGFSYDTARRVLDGPRPE